MTDVWRHLYDPATGTHYRNGGFISPDAGLEAYPPGFEWVEGRAPEGAQPYRELALIDRLFAVNVAGLLFMLQAAARNVTSVTLELGQSGTSLSLTPNFTKLVAVCLSSKLVSLLDGFLKVLYFVGRRLHRSTRKIGIEPHVE